MFTKTEYYIHTGANGMAPQNDIYAAFPILISVISFAFIIAISALD